MRKCFPLIVMIFLFAGCFGGTTPPVTIKHYAVEYALPRPEGRIASDAVVKMERFTAAQGAIGRDMVFRPKPFVRDAYRYHRWDVAPADAVQGLLLRDLRQAGFLRAVLSPDDSGAARYLVHGHVEEFLEVDEGDRSLARLVVGITVVDMAQEGPDGAIVLQKSYRMSEPMASRQPAETARSMSAAMARFSAAFGEDLDAIVKGHKK